MRSPDLLKRLLRIYGSTRPVAWYEQQTGYARSTIVRMASTVRVSLKPGNKPGNRPRRGTDPIDRFLRLAA